MNLSRSLSAMLGAALLAGCATTSVSTQTYLATGAQTPPWPAAAAFHVLSNENVQNPVFDESVKAKIESLLRSKGYRTVSSSQEADFLVDFSYEVVGVTRTDLRYHDEPLTYPYTFRSGRHFGRWRHTYLVQETYPAYVSKMALRVRRADTAGVEAKDFVWVGETSVEAFSPDLREQVDPLLAASFRHFGADTLKSREVAVKPDDPELKALSPRLPN